MDGNRVLSARAAGIRVKDAAYVHELDPEYKWTLQTREPVYPRITE